MCIDVCNSRTYTFDPSEPGLRCKVFNQEQLCCLRSSASDCTSVTEVDQVFLFILREEESDRTRPFSVPAFAKTFEWCVDRSLASVTRSTELDFDPEDGLLLRFRLQQLR